MSTTPDAGQFGVVRTKGFVPWMIRLFTRSQVNHAFLCLGDGRIIEAQTKGMVEDVLSKYDGHRVAFSRIEYPSAEALDSVLEAMRDLLDTPYNFADIAALGLLCMGIRWQWLIDYAQSSKSLICSQAIARGTSNGGCHLFGTHQRDGLVTPEDLLWWIAQEVPATFTEPLASAA